MWSRIRSCRLIVPLLLFLPMAAFAEESYTFDVSEIEKKPCHFGGYVEFRPVLYVLDRDSAFYRLQSSRQDRGSTRMEWNGRLRLEGSYEKGIGRLYVKTDTDYGYSSPLGSEERTALFEGYGTLKPSPFLKLELGRKVLKWGKGYAWNPVNFLDRSKDPDDPELPIEGYIMATADYIRSFDGPLKTFSFTPVLFPVYDHVNEGFGINNRLNIAGKIYLLLYDTDLDFIYVADGSLTARLGLDFSRNITTNLEIHGELAHIRDHRQSFPDADGIVPSESRDVVSGLLGIRYLSAFDLTTIFEYYHNGMGYSADDMKDYFRFIRRACQLSDETGNARPLNTAQTLSQSGYGRNSPMEDYFYLRLIQKEPFDILYFTPALTVMCNLKDRSHTITPEVLYTGFTNLELRFRAGFIRGGRDTEFGEKQNDFRFEFRMGYYF